MYKIKEEDLRNLENYLQEIPFKYANNIIGMLRNTLIKEEVVEPQPEKQTKDKK